MVKRCAAHHWSSRRELSVASTEASSVIIMLSKPKIAPEKMRSILSWTALEEIWLEGSGRRGGGDDTVEEEDEGEARWRKGWGVRISSGGTRELRICRAAAVLGSARVAAVVGGARAERCANSGARLREADGGSGSDLFKSCIGKSSIDKPVGNPAAPSPWIDDGMKLLPP
uniref:Uncharacterized protein n=1 Tax=Oryza glumipatula TaxID=40148 RepID=A0A0D9YAL6_9ORYZ